MLRITLSTLLMIAAHLLVAVPASLAPQTAAPVTPSMIVARGLPVRADTMDGLVGPRGKHDWFGSYVYAIQRSTEQGKPSYVLTMNYRAKGEGSFQSDTLVVDAATLSPLWRRFHARTDSASVTYSGLHASGWALRNGKRVQVNGDLHPGTFEGALLRWVVPMLPLAPGYSTAITTFDIWKNAEETSRLAVTGAETVTVGDRKIDSWVVSASGVRRWVAKSGGFTVQLQSATMGGAEYWIVAR